MLGCDIDSGRPIHYHDRTSHEVRDRVCRLPPPMLPLSEAEHGVYHDRRVSDALHRHRIFDTTPMSPNPLIPSPLLPLTSYPFFLFTFFLLKKFVI